MCRCLNGGGGVLNLDLCVGTFLLNPNIFNACVGTGLTDFAGNAIASE